MWTRPRRAIEVAGLLVAVMVVTSHDHHVASAELMIVVCSTEAANSGERFNSDSLRLVPSQVVGMRSRWWWAGAVSLLAAVVLTLAVSANGARAAGVGSWAATGSLPERWAGGSAVTLANGQVLAVGGGLTERDHEPSAIYDPGSGTWLQGPELPGSEDHWTLVALAGGGALLLGETVCRYTRPFVCAPTTSAYVLGPKEAEWTPTGSMHEARVEPAVAGLADGRVLVAGGFGAQCEEGEVEGFLCAPISSAEVYDPATGQWTLTAPMPQADGAGSATLLSDGRVLVAGGGEGFFAGSKMAALYDPSSGTWTVAGQTTSSRASPLLFGLTGDRALTLGSQPWAGYGSLGGAATRRKLACYPITSEIFTEATDAWAASLPTPTGSEGCSYSAGALLTGGVILVGVSGAHNDEMYLLDPEQRCWSATGPVVEPRNEGEVVALADGRALVFGGSEANGYEGRFASAEIYTPGPDGCDPAVVGKEAQPSPSPPGPVSGPKESNPPRFVGARIIRRGRLTISKSGAIRLAVSCPASAVVHCAGHVRVALSVAIKTASRIGRHTKNMFLGDAPFAATAGKTTTVTVCLIGHRRTLDALIHRWRQATAILTATAHDGTGRLVTTTTSQTLR